MTHPCLRSIILCATLLIASAGAQDQPSAPSIFGVNQIVNGDAESGLGVDRDIIVDSIPGWTSNGVNVLTYASGYGVATKDIVPAGAGQNYFSNGDTSSSMTQSIDLSAGADVIDAGTATFDISGYFGGYAGHDDNATLTIAFLDGTGSPLKIVSIGGVLWADRYGTGLYLRRQLGVVPAGTRSARVTLDFVMLGYTDNNAGADNLSLVLNSPATLPTLFDGRNLILDGDAESAIQTTNDPDFASDVPNWVRTANFTADAYGAGGADMDANSPGPTDRGKFYFYGGPSNAASSAYQDVDLSLGASQIDSGSVSFTLSAWIGGYASQGDYTVLTLQFLDWSGTILSTTLLGPVSPDDRGDISALLQQATSGAVPAGARMAHVQLDMTRTAGSDDDGLADSLSLTLSVSGDGNNSQRKQSRK